MQNINNNSAKTALAVFVKTPDLSPVKTRLAATIGRENAVEFYLSCVTEIRKTIGNLPQNINSYWAIAEENAINSKLWNDQDNIKQGDGNLGDRLHEVYSQLIEKYGNVIIIGSDSPQITNQTISSAITKLEDHDFAIGATHDGGFYLFSGKKPVPKKVWTEVTYSQNNTLEQLLSKLDNVAFLPQLTDVDVVADIAILIDELPHDSQFRALLKQKFI